MRNKQKFGKSKSASAVTIIGGADGPTSIFLAGKISRRKCRVKQNPLRRFRNWYTEKYNKKRREQVIKNLVPRPHTLDALAVYITKKYHAIKLLPDSSEAGKAWRNMKTSIVWREYEEKMKELGYVSPKEKCPKNMQDTEKVKKWKEYMEEYEEAAAGLSDSLVRMDFYVYKIPLGKTGAIKIEMEKVRGILNAGVCCEQKERQYAKRILGDIYQYYGVTQKDIDQTTDRYLTLVSTLAEIPRQKKYYKKRLKKRKKR